MASDALKLTQLAGLLAGHSKLFTANNPGQNEFANYLLASAQAGQQGLLAEEAAKKQKKKEKGIFGGKVGSLLGTAAGIALAPATGGLSLAAGGALGGAIGGAGGSLLSGGSPSFSSVASDAASGGLAGYAKAGELAQTNQIAATQADVPASPTLAQNIETSIGKGLPNANVISNPMIQKVGAAPLTSRVPATPFPVSMQSQSAVPAPMPKPGFKSRFGSALGSMLQPQSTQMRPLFTQLPDGTRRYDPYR